MSDEATSLVRLLYRGILRREPDDPGLDQWTKAMKDGLSPSEIATAFIESDEFRGSTAVPLHVPPGHYYSPVTNPREAERAIAAIEAEPWPETLPGIGIDRGAMITTWNALLPYFSRNAFPVSPTQGFRYAYDNPSYSWGDGSVLQAMIRIFSPRRIIEVGNGWSSACMLDCVELYLEKECEFTFIDPHQGSLQELIGPTKASVRFLECGVQEVPKEIFDDLEKDDILFIDSTHVLKTGSDVGFELFHILPRLKSGVLVHIHDMFWPFEYPRLWAVDENRAWNELYAVRAFLMFNEQWEIVMFNDYLAKIEPQMIESTWSPFLINSGGALWLRRK